MPHLADLAANVLRHALVVLGLRLIYFMIYFTPKGAMRLVCWSPLGLLAEVF